MRASETFYLMNIETFQYIPGLSRLLDLPIKDTNTRRRATTFVVICVTLMAVLSVAGVVMTVTLSFERPDLFYSMLLGMFVTIGASAALARSGRLTAAGMTLALITTGIATGFSLMVRTFDPVMLTLLVNTVVVGFVLTPRGVGAVLVLNTAAVGLVFAVHHDSVIWTRRETVLMIVVGTIQVALAFCAYINTLVNEAFFNAEVETARTQEALRKEAEAASRSKSQFLANMSHELRTPLNAIIGYSEMLSEEYEFEERQEEPGYDDLQKITGAGKHLLSLISNILDLSKIESGHIDLNVEQVEVAALFEELRAMTLPLTEQSDDALRVELPAAPLTIETDHALLRRVLLNLLSNATKFTNEGTITLRARRDDDAPEHVLLEVEDTGVGISAEHQERIFEAFEQEDVSATRQYGGAGLGLTLVFEMTRLLGGRVTLDSTPDVGSTFGLHMPRRASSPRTTP